jgi:hypothetical protein
VGKKNKGRGRRLDLSLGTIKSVISVVPQYNFLKKLNQPLITEVSLNNKKLRLNILNFPRKINKMFSIGVALRSLGIFSKREKRSVRGQKVLISIFIK